MSKRIWLDANVVLDLVLDREGFVEDASKLFCFTKQVTLKSTCLLYH